MKRRYPIYLRWLIIGAIVHTSGIFAAAALLNELIYRLGQFRPDARSTERWTQHAPVDALRGDDWAWSYSSAPRPWWNTTVIGAWTDATREGGSDWCDRVSYGLSEHADEGFPANGVVVYERTIGFPFPCFRGRRWKTGTAYNASVVAGEWHPQHMVVRSRKHGSRWLVKSFPIGILWLPFLLNCVLFGGAIAGVTALIRASAKRFIPNPLTCYRCGYSLHGQTSVRCPECGETPDVAYTSFNTTRWRRCVHYVSITLFVVGIAVFTAAAFALFEINRWTPPSSRMPAVHVGLVAIGLWTIAGTAFALARHRRRRHRAVAAFRWFMAVLIAALVSFGIAFVLQLIVISMD